MPRTELEYQECLEQKEKSYRQDEGIGIIVKKCWDGGCPFHNECYKFRIYPAKEHHIFVKNMLSILEA